MKLFKSALICTVISSAAIMLIPLEEISTSWENAMRFAVPIIFWAGLAAEQILFGLCRKSIGAAEKPARNKAFTAACTAFAVLLAAFIVMSAANIGANAAQFVVLSLLVLSLRCIFIFRGKCFRYYSEIKDVKKIGKRDLAEKEREVDDI